MWLPVQILFFAPTILNKQFFQFCFVTPQEYEIQFLTIHKANYKIFHHWPWGFFIYYFGMRIFSFILTNDLNRLFEKSHCMSNSCVCFPIIAFHWGEKCRHDTDLISCIANYRVIRAYITSDDVLFFTFFYRSQCLDHESNCAETVRNCSQKMATGPGR